MSAKQCFHRQDPMNSERLEGDSGTQRDPGARPVISVIIPTYNHASVLPRALDSIFAQEGTGDLFELEVIVVDDASSEDTGRAVRRYPQARYVRLPTNRGAPSARNAGLEVATGEYVGFLDDDDLWLPYKLKIQLPVLEAHPDAGLLYGQNIVLFGDQVSVWPGRDAPSGRVFQRLLMGNFVPIRTVLARQAALRRVGGFDESLSILDVNDMWLRLAFHFPFVFQPGPVAIYRRHPGGLYIRGIVDGRSEREAEWLTEKALALLPETDEGATVRREVRARVRIGFADELRSVGELGRLREQLVSTLQEFTSLAGKRWMREAFGRLASDLSRMSQTPIAAVAALRRDVACAQGTLSLRDRWRMRRLWGRVWLDLARILAHDGSRIDRVVAAGVRALLCDPSLLRRRVTVDLILRTVDSLPGPRLGRRRPRGAPGA